MSEQVPSEQSAVGTLEREDTHDHERSTTGTSERGKPAPARPQRPESGKTGPYQEGELSVEAKKREIARRYAGLPEFLRKDIEAQPKGKDDMLELIGIQLFTKELDQNDPVLLEAARKKVNNPFLSLGLDEVVRQTQSERPEEASEFAASETAHSENAPVKASKTDIPEGAKPQAAGEQVKAQDKSDEEEQRRVKELDEIWEAHKKHPNDVELQNKLHKHMLEHRQKHAEGEGHGASGLKKNGWPEYRSKITTAIGVAFYLYLLGQYLVAKGVEEGAGGK